MWMHSRADFCAAPAGCSFSFYCHASRGSDCRVAHRQRRDLALGLLVGALAPSFLMLARSAAIRSTTLLVGLYTTFGTALTKRYPRILKALLNLQVQSIVLDGEVPLIDADGRRDFNVLHSRLSDAWVPLYAFDLLELNGEDYRERPRLERKQVRKDVVEPARAECRTEIVGCDGARDDLGGGSQSRRCWGGNRSRRHQSGCDWLGKRNSARRQYRW
ncbi:MAG: hypothetical protein ACJ8AF_02685 [Gemmatimonadaceae bacterium]